MKKHIRQSISIMLAVLLIVPFLSMGNSMVASAKDKKVKIPNPTFTISEKTLVENGDTFTVSLKNLGSNVERIVWYSLNCKIATVAPSYDPYTATITSVRSGTTFIRSEVTYKNGTTKQSKVKVKVKVAATSIKISNEKLNNEGMHVIEAGKKYNFNVKLSPRNSKSNTYWFISNNQTASVDSKGFVKGLEPGIVELTAVAAMSKDGAKTSTVKDTIKIKIVASRDYDHDDDDDDDDDHDDDHDGGNTTTNGINITLPEANRLVITFDKAIDKNTIIGQNNTLLNSILITPKADAGGAAAMPLGTLTAGLSADGKVLTLQNTNIFKGIYGIHFTTAIKTVSGTALQDYVRDYAIYDTTKPQYKSYTVDPSGLLITFNFSETMNFNNMYPGDGKAVVSTQTLQPSTLSILNSRSSYTVSADRKSLILNLTNMPAEDRNKELSVKFFGIKDLADNAMATEPVTVSFKTNTTLQPQAKLVSLERTDYNTLTATFDKPIKTSGMVVINTENIYGTVNPLDLTKVTYKLSAASALLTGYQKVYIGYWEGFNVLPNDTTGDTLVERYVNFSVNNLIPLPAPVAVTQSPTDNSVLFIQFNQLLDEATAENRANYSIPGATVAAAELTNGTNSATVKLTLQQGSLATTNTYVLTITGIKGFNGSFKEMNPYQATLVLKENTPPVLLSYNFYYPTSILLTFSENITGTPNLQVFQGGINLATSSVINGKTITITLSKAPVLTESLQLVPGSANLILDLAGNTTTSILTRTIMPTTY